MMNNHTPVPRVHRDFVRRTPIGIKYKNNPLKPDDEKVRVFHQMYLSPFSTDAEVESLVAELRERHRGTGIRSRDMFGPKPYGPAVNPLRFEWLKEGSPGEAYMFLGKFVIYAIREVEGGLVYCGVKEYDSNYGNYTFYGGSIAQAHPFDVMPEGGFDILTGNRRVTVVPKGQSFTIVNMVLTADNAYLYIRNWIMGILRFPIAHLMAQNALSRTVVRSLVEQIVAQRLYQGDDIVKCIMSFVGGRNFVDVSHYWRGAGPSPLGSLKDKWYDIERRIQHAAYFDELT